MFLDLLITTNFMQQLLFSFIETNNINFLHFIEYYFRNIIIGLTLSFNYVLNKPDQKELLLWFTTILAGRSNPIDTLFKNDYGFYFDILLLSFYLAMKAVYYYFDHSHIKQLNDDTSNKENSDNESNTEGVTDNETIVDNTVKTNKESVLKELLETAKPKIELSNEVAKTLQDELDDKTSEPQIEIKASPEFSFIEDNVKSIVTEDTTIEPTEANTTDKPKLE